MLAAKRFQPQPGASLHQEYDKEMEDLDHHLVSALKRISIPPIKGLDQDMAQRKAGGRHAPEELVQLARLPIGEPAA